MIISMYLKYKEMVNYAIVGGLTTVVSLMSYYICVMTLLNPHNGVQLQLANVISWLCAVIFAFVTNRKYVFESENPNRLLEATKFFGARIMTLLIDMISMAIFVSFAEINDKIAKIMVQFIVFSLNYVFSKFFVFKKLQK